MYQKSIVSSKRATMVGRLAALPSRFCQLVLDVALGDRVGDLEANVSDMILKRWRRVARGGVQSGQTRRSSSRRRARRAITISVMNVA